MKKIGIVVVAMACAGFLVAAPAFAASVSDAESSTSATGPDSSAYSGVISVATTGGFYVGPVTIGPVAATTHISVATAGAGEASAYTRGDSSATTTTADGVTYEATTERGRTSATAVGNDPGDGPAVGVGVHGAGTGAGGILLPSPSGGFGIAGGAGAALSLSTASTGGADNAGATAGSGGNAQATVTGPDPDPIADFSVRRANTTTAVSMDDTAGGGGYAAGLSTVFAGGFGGKIGYTQFDPPFVFSSDANVSAAGLNSVAFTEGGGGAVGSATTSAEGTAIAELSTLDDEFWPAYTFADAAGRTNASAAFQSPTNGDGTVLAFSGKDAIAGSALAVVAGQPPVTIPINFAAGALFAGTYAAGGSGPGDGFQFEASASAINDPPGPGWSIDPAAFASGPNGETYAEIGALYGTAQANSNLQGAIGGPGGGGSAGNIAAAIALGLADQGAPLQVAGIGLVTLAGAEGGGAVSLPVNDAQLQRIYGNVYADAFNADGVRNPGPFDTPNPTPYEDVTWATLRNGGAFASAPDTSLPRTAGTTIGDLQAWGDPLAPFNFEIAIGLDIIPPTTYIAAGIGLGLAVSSD